MYSSCFLAISAVLGFLCHYCFSCYQTKSRLHTTISTVVHAEAVCAHKIHLFGNFFIRSLRSEIIAPWKVSRFQKSPRITLKTSVFYHHFQVSFFLSFPWRANWTRPRKEPGSNVNLISTDSGMVNWCTILTPSRQNILLGLQWALTLSKMPSKATRCGETDGEANSSIFTFCSDFSDILIPWRSQIPKRVNNRESSRWRSLDFISGTL